RDQNPLPYRLAILQQRLLNSNLVWSQDLNLGEMSEGSKPLSFALPLGDTPTKRFDYFTSNREVGAEGET
ncbi:hypothetical protein, partial [Pseudoalteromonas amylolytica]|uniref:hypothetical protein n=2 Tax=Pseudoalteromonas TaxID=53246 RepID=UPI001981E5E0